jgi:CRISPR/Cas system-associated protein Cas10 (large subunit of type III CRISPR-Cas system)
MGQWLTGRYDKTPKLSELNPALLLDQALRDRKRPLFPALHGELSQRLGQLALALYAIVEEEHLGRVVYSGGDDLLALLPLQTALPCLRAVRATIRSEEHLGARVTVSAGVAVAHVRAPLRTALRLAREAEKAAKGPRNSFAIKLDKRSGEALDLVLPFEVPGEDGEAIDVLGAIAEMLSWKARGTKENPLRSVNVAYRLREEALSLAGLPEAFRHRIRVLLDMKPEDRWPLLESLHLDVPSLADLLLFVRFLLREERGIETGALLAKPEKGAQ